MLWVLYNFAKNYSFLATEKKIVYLYRQNTFCYGFCCCCCFNKVLLEWRCDYPRVHNYSLLFKEHRLIKQQKKKKSEQNEFWWINKLYSVRIFWFVTTICIILVCCWMFAFGHWRNEFMRSCDMIACRFNKYFFNTSITVFLLSLRNFGGDWAQTSRIYWPNTTSNISIGRPSWTTTKINQTKQKRKLP